MEALISYIIKSCIGSGILYAYYLLALRNKRFHTYNRFYLLISVGLSLLLPAFNFSYTVKNIPTAPLKAFFIIINPAHTTQSAGHYTVDQCFFYFAVIVSFFLLCLLFSRIYWIYGIKRKYRNTRMDGFTLIETDVKQAPFTFLDNLFWRQNMSATDPNGEKIFKHELTHIKQWHTYDKLFVQVVLCLFWINPFYWLIQKELNMIHEFIADEASVKKGDTAAFARMLLRSHNDGRYLNPTNSFFSSPIKRRLIMISSAKNVRYSYLRRVFVLPVIIAVVMFSSVTNVRAQSDPRLNPNDSVKIKQISLEKRNDSIADVKVNYVDARGRAAVLNIAAKYSKIDSLKGDNSNKAFIRDDETGETKEISHAEVRDIVQQIIQNPPSDEIYFVDGTEYLRESVKKLDPQKIKTLNHYTKEDAIKRYGEKARNGVFVFTTK